MHDFDDSARHQHKFRIRGKWELILVMFVVIAGIIVTTIAVLKAKERRDTFSNSIVEDGSNPRLQVIDSSSPRFDSEDTFDANVRDHNNNLNRNRNGFVDGEIGNDDSDLKQTSRKVDLNSNNHSNLNNHNSHNNNGNNHKRAKNNQKNRYQAEKEFTDTTNGEFLSESRQLNKHLNAPGSEETTLDDMRGRASNIETTKVLLVSNDEDHVTQKPMLKKHRTATSGGPLQNDGLPGYPPPYGFIPSAAYASENSNQNPQAPSQRPRNVEYSENGSGFLLAADMMASSTTNHDVPNAHKIMNRPLMNSEESTSVRVALPNQPVHLPPPPQQQQPLPPQQPLMPNFKKEIKPPNMVPISRRNHQNAPNHVPNNQELMHAIASDSGNYLSQRELMWLQQNRPELFSAMLDPAFGQLHRAPRERRDLMSEDSRNRRKSVKYFEDNDDDQREQTGNKYHDKHRQTDDSYAKENFHKVHPRTKSSNKEPNNSARRRKNRYSVTSNADDEGNQIFRDPSIKKRKRKQKKYLDTKKKGNKYTNEQESKKVEKYDILGSGNFEIIRGGILDKYDDNKNKDKRPKLANTNVTDKKKVEASQRKNDEPKSTYDYEDNESPVDQDDEKKDDTEDEADPENFEPFNFDLFGSDPILGFQGYDNFGSNRNNNNNNNGLNNIGL